MNIGNLVNVMLYYSGIQSTQLGRADAYFHELGMTWIVTDYEIKVNRLPRAFEEITIVTEAKSYNKFFTYRDFEVFDEQGNLLVTLHSTFSLMKIEERKLASLKAEYLEPYEADKIKTIRRGPQLPNFDEPFAKDFEVRYSDLDTNNHVNNSKYLNWVLDTLSLEFLSTHEMAHMHVRFVKEIAYGHTVHSLAEEQENQTIHQIQVDGVVHFESLITWRSYEV
jgi:medium-chain acyl-[acyl-carrier-protein] hydrolase